MINGRILVFLFLFFGALHPLVAQVSVKMGYNVGFMKEEPQAIFSTLRNRKAFLALEDKHFNNLQGVVFGVRYKSTHFASDLDFTYSFWSIQGSGTNPTTAKNEKIKSSLINSSLGWSVEGLIGNFGIGTSTHYNIFTQKIKSNVDGNIKSRSNYWSQKIFLGLYIPGSRHTVLAFRPFMDIPFGNINLYFTEERLNPNRDIEPAKFDYKPSAFGIQFLFLNGG